MGERLTIAFNAALLREPYSGVEVTIDESARALAEHGALNYRIYTSGRSDVRRLPLSPRFAVIPAVQPLNLRLARIGWEQVRLPGLLRRAGVDVLHAPAYVAPLAAPCPVVLTIHDLHVYTHPTCCTWLNRLHYRLLMPASIRRAAALVVYSEHVRAQVTRRFPCAAGKLHVIPPGVPRVFQRAPSAETLDRVRARYRLPPRYLLFVGDYAPRKNLPRLMEAFDRLDVPDVHLVLAGAAKASERQRAAAYARVHALGYVPEDDLPSLYALAEALALPSLDEGFGLPVLEAMACGCPVVCGPGGAAEVGGDAVVCCDPNAPDSIAAALRALPTDPVARAERIARGRRRAGGFRWPETVAKLEALYSACV